jgi:hypothetical protein
MADEKITNADYVDVTTTDNKEMNEKTSVVPVTSHEPYDAISHNINIGEFSANPAVRSYCTLACWFFFFFFFFSRAPGQELLATEDILLYP